MHQRRPSLLLHLCPEPRRVRQDRLHHLRVEHAQVRRYQANPCGLRSKEYRHEFDRHSRASRKPAQGLLLERLLPGKGQCLRGRRCPPVVTVAQFREPSPDTSVPADHVRGSRCGRNKVEDRLLHVQEVRADPEDREAKDGHGVNDQELCHPVRDRGHARRDVRRCCRHCLTKCRRRPSRASRSIRGGPRNGSGQW